jgi:hypothetical protein
MGAVPFHDLANLLSLTVRDDNDKHLMRLERIEDGPSNTPRMSNARDNPRVLYPLIMEG